ncbi:flagellar biosynthesis protein FliQ [Curtobacterium ammoniigenes]|uniref:flagellar biosynthesis protein FliQ n=1 Tax=Curtobacterium ammoniigenes TaxID=395387 RepID=UPI00082C3D4A|nr:flagellar biosynthesis protein FliQ [Curtobacterium ammoniigenes]
MNSAAVLKIAAEALTMMAELAAPMVLTALVIGFAISLIQSITQIQEVTLSFVPKAVGVAIALMICGSWMIAQLVSFTQQLFAQIPSLLGG